MSSWNFKLASFSCLRNSLSRRCHERAGSGGPVRFILGIDNMVKVMNFLFHTPTLKTHRFRKNVLLENTWMTVKRSSQLQTCSASLTMIYAFAYELAKNRVTCIYICSKDWFSEVFLSFQRLPGVARIDGANPLLDTRGVTPSRVL